MKENRIAQVGYEVELDSQSIRQEQIAVEMGLSFDRFVVPAGHNLLVKMSDEYYPSTIEFNFMKEEFSENLHGKIKKFLKAVMKKFNLRVYGNAPSFVGTHIHFFRSHLSKVDPDIILRMILHFIIENITDLHPNSVQRVTCSHQLWGNYAHHHPEIHAIRRQILGDEFQFQDMSRTKIKYRPILESERSTTGKMRSIEIRLIPTEFILNDKILIFLKNLEEMNIPNEDVPTLYSKLATLYLGLRQ